MATPKSASANPSILWLPFWLLARSITAFLWSTNERYIANDVYYYLGQITSDQPALVEYPAPIWWFFELLGFLCGYDQQLFLTVFVCLITALDLVITWYLWTKISVLAAGYWLVFTFLVGPLMWFRFDLVPGAAITFCLIWALKRPRLSGALLAGGAAVKLWPALLISCLLGTSKCAKKRSFGFLATGLILGLSSLLFAGWQRSISPLTWQSDRGLQIESLPATFLMAIRGYISSDQFDVQLSQYNAYEISGPQVNNWLTVSDIAMYLAVIFIIALAWLIVLGGYGLAGHSTRNVAAREGSPLHSKAILFGALSIIFVFIAANKTFSPQYLIWLAGPLALTVSFDGKSHKLTQLIGICGLFVAGLTHIIYPLAYGALISTDQSPDVTTALVIRNLMVLALAIITMVAALIYAYRLGKPLANPNLDRETISSTATHNQTAAR